MTSTSLEQRTRLPDQVVAQLLTAVADSTYPPGTRLPSEGLLAEWAGVSRLTLREAVKVLRDKRVLRVEQGRGTFVNPPVHWSPLDPTLVASRTVLEGDRAQTAVRVTEARRVVEVGAAGLAAQRRTEADLARLRDAVHRMVEAHERDDVHTFSAADLDFHDAVTAAAGNPFLAALLEPVMALLREIRETTSVDSGARAAGIRAHQEILAAIEAADDAAARERMSEHMAQTHRAIERAASAPRTRTARRRST